MDASMPSPFGHALAGVAVALAGGTRERAPFAIRRFLAHPLTLWSVALAALPDADLLVPGFHRTVTHSVFTTLIVMIVATAVTGWVTRRRPGARGSGLEAGASEMEAGGWRLWVRVALLFGAAHASHILLDWLGGDRSQPAGIQAFWPWSHRWFISGWDLFPQIERRQPFSRASMAINLYALAWELLLMGTVAAVLWGWRARPRLPQRRG
jgi:membrane-bound metal-dependent hydrolase YbcI (DUF457 family)